MSLLLAVVLLAQDPIEVSGTVRSEPYDFEIAVPKGWTPFKGSGSTFFRLVAPPGTVADGATWLAHQDANHPVTLAYLTDFFRKRGAAEYPGYKDISEKAVSAAGYPGRQIVFSARSRGDKELVFVHTILQRQLQEYFVLDVIGAPSEKDRIVALSDRLLASFRSGLPGVKERDDRIARTAAMFKAKGARPELAGTFWHEILFGQQKLGWQRHVLREAKVDGQPGWEFELESRQADAEGGSRVDLSTGSFTADGSVQKLDYRRTVKTPKDPQIDVRETAVLSGGAVKATREFLDQKLEKEFKVADGTYFSDIAETMRRLIALAEPGRYSIRILEPFREIPGYEDWMNGGSSRIKVDGAERLVIHSVVSFQRQDPVEYLFDPDGSLRRRKGGDGPLSVVLRRCTEEEARRK